MRKLLCVMCVFIMSIGFVFAQTKSNGKDSIRIEQYKSISPQNFQIVSEDDNGYNVTKNFTVEKAILVYERNKFIGFVLKSKDKAEAAFEVEKMMSEDSHGKQFWVDKNERFFVVITFSSDELDYRDMNIMFISNINGSILYNLSFDRISEK